MSNYVRPGTYVEETLLPRSPEFSSSDSAAVFVASHGRGPEGPHLVQNWADFARIYGGFPVKTSLLPHTLFQFFNNGGRDAYVIRVTGSGASVSDASFDDRDTSAAEETLVFKSKDVGTWGNDVAISISDAGDDRFNVTVFYGGKARNNIVERFLDVSMDPGDSRYVEAVINSELVGSTYVEVSDSESSNQDTIGYAGVRPVVTAGDPVALTGGSNGADPENTDFTDAIPLIEQIDRPWVANFPGVSETTVINAAVTLAESTGLGFVVADTPPDLNAAGAVSYASGLQSSSYVATYWPYLRTSDAGSATRGSSRLMPPGGAVVGNYLATDAVTGPWKAPAGLGNSLAGVVGTERVVAHADLDLLSLGHVNPIRLFPGAGFVIWGSRTRKKAQTDKFVPVRRALIYLAKSLRDSTAWVPFEANDENLWRTVESTIESFLNGVWQLGGLRGRTPAEAFYVRCDSTTNTAASIEAGQVNIEVGVAVQTPAEFVVIKLSQSEAGVSVDDIVSG